MKNAVVHSNYSTYSYVSLFGLQSPQDIWKSIFLNAESNKEANWWRKSTKSVEQNSATPTLAKIAGKYVKGVSGLDLADIAHISIKNHLICFDDIERKSDSLKVNELFGIACHLKEEKSCKVVLILNDEQLLGEHREEFEHRFEKAIDRHIRFTPTAEESFAIVEQSAGNTDIDFAYFKQCCTSLDINNIRIIKQVFQSIQSVWNLFESYPAPIKQVVIHSLTLFYWCKYGDNSPPIEYVRDRHAIQFLRQNTEKTEEQQKWDLLLSSYRFHSFDELDVLLLRFLENGYPDANSIKEQAKIIHRRIQNSEKIKRFEDAWARYRNSFANDDEKVLDEIYTAALDSLDAYSLMNLSSAVAFLREFGRESQADNLITAYLNHHANSESVVDFHNYSFRNEVRDAGLIAAIQDHIHKRTESRDPYKVLLDITQRHGWSEDDLEVLYPLDADDFYHLLKQNPGEELSAIVKQIFSIANHQENHPKLQAMKANAIAALKKIAADSPMNRSRVARYGIMIE